MATLTITTIDNASIELARGEHQDDTFLAAGADVVAEGTILARKLVSDTIAIAYTRAGGSDYTVVAAQQAGATLEIGDYVVTAGTLAAGVGTWTCVAPSGKSDTYTTTAAGDDLLFEELDIAFTTTVVATAWTTGDVITATVAAETGLPLVFFVKGTGTGGAQTPVAVLTYSHTVAGAGSTPIRPLISGVVNKNRLIIDADGDATNVDDAVLDQLRDYSISARDVVQLSTLDNGA
jgi:hypothetical protein